MTRAAPALALTILLLAACAPAPEPEPAPEPLVIPPSGIGALQVAPGGRYFQHADGRPFFWLGDTAWLLFKRLTREEADDYLEDRRRKGFNVIQAMVLHGADDVNAYGAAALVDEDPGQPKTTPGADWMKEGEYDFWDHVDWVVEKAAEKELFVAMVAAWGSNARSGKLNEGNVEAYTRFLADRYGDRPNIIWVTGGDTQGDRETAVWQTMGRLFKQLDPDALVTFHPFGRTQSSTWFHKEPWLDFDMFQSGHRRYDQDDSPDAKGEDNWRYVEADRALEPPKPTLDGEPSYEGIPQGLHDPKEPYWTDAAARRYAWWAVFAGAAGHTYGHSAIMQMHKPEHGKGAYGVRETWDVALQSPGSAQMQHLKNLILARPGFERVPDQSLVAGRNGKRYDYVIATRGPDYAYLYTYTGRDFSVRLGALPGTTLQASWYNPRNGESQPLGAIDNSGERAFNPPGEPALGNDWALTLLPAQ
ncbi:MAG: glycoside hydrolase family 140 protein [Acidobacteria bacterium]|nr:glycoside hydrolase family 140 protein [Acidobacteriota bacterium]